MRLAFIKSMFYLFALQLCLTAPAIAASEAVVTPNLASLGTMRSWQSGIVAIPGHEPDKANDNSRRSYWELHAENIPGDLGIEWKQPQTFSSLVVRYFSGHMTRGPWVARTQQQARLQFWDGHQWRSIEAQVVGQETATVRYSFKPVTATRVRLLFTEPANPQLRVAAPGATGIFVCEFEVYREPPFQLVTCPGCLQETGRQEPSYNEEPASDSPVDLAGPLIIEPKQSRVFRDTLRSNLIVSDTSWAKLTATASTSKVKATIGNGFLTLHLLIAKRLHEAKLRNNVTGESVSLDHSLPFRLRLNEGVVLSSNAFSVSGADTIGSTTDQARLNVHLAAANLLADVHYELRREDHFFHKWITLTSKDTNALNVKDITVSSFGLPNAKDLMAGNELTYPVSQFAKGGFFECIESVYWDHDADAMTYYPDATLEPGKSLDSEKAVLGIYQNSGDFIAGWDRGLREWLIEYHAHVSPLPAAWPDIYLEGWSAHVGIAEMKSDLPWTNRFLDMASKLGVRYMDTREDMFRVLHYSPDTAVQWNSVANNHGIGTGFWVDFGDLHDDNGEGSPIQPQPCKLSAAAEDYYQQTLKLVSDLQLKALHWADFFTAWPCAPAFVGSLDSKYSIYKQGQRMLRFAREMHDASPGIMIGADGGLTSPQYGRFADDRQHGGGNDAAPAWEQDIHLDRLYSGMNREYLTAAHLTYLRPWYRLLNCVNHFGDETHSNDLAGYRYALLSAFGLTGQLTFNDAPLDTPESEINFTQKWEQWVRTHSGYFTHTDRLFDRSTAWNGISDGDGEALQGFAHIREDGGYIFLSNPTPVPQVAQLALDLDTNLLNGLLVDTIFPLGAGVPNLADGSYRRHDVLRTVVPGKQVQILHIAPAKVKEGMAPSYPPAQPKEQRFVDHWSAARTGSMDADLRADFRFPSSGAPYLNTEVEDTKWTAEPWAYNKAYLVLYLKNEKGLQSDDQVLKNLPISIRINGITKQVHPFVTKRNQGKDLTRCFFIALDKDVKAGELNHIELHLPIRQGLVFSGAYVDLPDQMPGSLPPE